MPCSVSVQALCHAKVTYWFTLVLAGGGICMKYVPSVIMRPPSDIPRKQSTVISPEAWLSQGVISG